MGTLAAVPTGSAVDPCCCEEAECCLYPWPDPDGTPLYPETDLPDAVEYDGDILNHDVGLYTFTGTTYYIEAGATQWELRLVADDSLVLAMDCLVGYSSDPSRPEDQFSNTYVVTSAAEPDPITITRVSLCDWEYVDPLDPSHMWHAFYLDGGIDRIPPMEWRIVGFGPGFSVGQTKNAPQDGPAGVYGGGGSATTVS